MTLAALAAHWLLGAVFIAAFVLKVRDVRAFAVAVQQLLPRTPKRLTTTTAAATLVAEIAIAALLAVHRVAWIGCIAAAVTLCAFTVVLVSAVRRDQDVSCRCFGAARQPIRGYHIARNVALILVAVVGAFPHNPPAAGDLAVAAVVGLSGAAATVLLDTIVTVFASTRVHPARTTT
jgi:hypothetical protein